ncbi:MAG: ricin-type beta-trefoil lectin domain protein [Trebonia sp.]
MHKFRKAAAIFAATGLAAFGAMAASGGTANAATNQSITGCSINSALLGVQVIPTCSGPTGTIYNPTQITATVAPSFLQGVLGKLGLGVRVSYELACVVDGSTVTAHEHFTARDAHSNVQVVNLQREVGSPEPNQCQVQDLTATSLVGLSIVFSPVLSFAVSVTGDNGVPGAIWAQYPPSTSGAGSTVCADDTGNGNAGTPIQAFQCEQDLADQWMQVSGQLVHNGDCMTNVGGSVKLEKCMGHYHAAPNQAWRVSGTPFSAGTITNGPGWCLSAPSSGVVDTANLTVQRCGAKGFTQMWKAPANTPV